MKICRDVHGLDDGEVIHGDEFVSVSVDMLNVDSDLKFGDNGLDGAEVVEVAVSRFGVSVLDSFDCALIIASENDSSCINLVGLV